MKIDRLLAMAIVGSIVAAWPVTGEESPIEKAASAGRIKILESEKKPPAGRPDLLFFKSGKILEAWNLAIQDDVVSFQVRGPGGEAKDVSTPKSQINTIQIGLSLAAYRAEVARQQPAEAPEVRLAAQQPTPKKEVLSGRFGARQGEYTRWSFTFTSELNKFYTFAEDATEYGLFRIRSHHKKPVGSGKYHENEVIATGKYFLYAPGVFSKNDWVLNLTRVTYTENDVSPHKTFFTERLPDEVFIVKFTPDRNVFNLAWANHSSWQWTAPVLQTFYRLDRKPPTSAGSGRTRSVLVLPPILRGKGETAPGDRRSSSEKPAPVNTALAREEKTKH